MGNRQQACQKFIYKLHSTRLRDAKWNLNLPLQEARRNDEIISLADSQILRWIDEFNGVLDAEQQARQIKAEIRHIKKQPNSLVNRRKIKKLYQDLDEVQFVPDYMCLIIDKEKDYYRACRGFTINCEKYRRLLGTNGGVKNKTIVFVKEKIIEKLNARINNGRNAQQELVPAKLEAYKALTCSASTPVSMPKGILVVSDCETQFQADVIYINDENDGEPEMKELKNEPITLDASDGFGLMLPSLAQRWGEELKLNYLPSGLNTRFAWEKGMVFTFDFLEFAESVAHNYIVKDVWGNDVDIRNVELVLTSSMLKLWDAYESCEDYLRNCQENQYTFAVTKVAPQELEEEHALNYQFIQSYDLDEKDIEELVAPTISEIKDVLSLDWRKTVLFLKGIGLNEKNVKNLPDDFAKALMIEPTLLSDPYVLSSVYQLIRNRITQAKVGVINVHGNYSIVSGDPYSLCQHIFGLEVTGLLKSGEIYNKYWFGCEAEKVACFRAPMTCANNIRLMSVSSSKTAEYWYRYINTCTVFNSWDTSAMALNGMDKQLSLCSVMGIENSVNL